MADFISQLSGPEMDNALQEVNAHNAEAWSSGTRGGVQVASGDPTYDNNAKYWAQVAKSAIPAGSTGAVLFSQSQQLSDSAKAQARDNISAGNPTSTVAGGKNLFNPRWLLNGSIDETGKPIDAGAYVITEFIEIKPDATYTTWTSIPTRYIEVYFYDSNYGFIRNSGVDTTSQTYTFATSSNCKYVRLLFGGSTTPHRVSSGYLYQLEEGNTATPYEPYYESNLQLTRKQNIVNLLNPTLVTTTQNGITCTNNGDGTYTLNGTATATTFFYVRGNNTFKEGVTYKLVGCPKGGSGNTYLIRPHSNNNQPYDEGNGCAFVYSSSNPPDFPIRIGSGVTCNSLVFKPMITTNLDATYDDFVEYGHYLPSIMQTQGNLSIQNLIFSGCVYSRGGYVRIGNLVVIELQVTINSGVSVWGTILTGLPSTNGEAVPLSVTNIATNDIIQLDVAYNGIRAIKIPASPTTRTYTVNISGVYICV